MNGGFAWFDKLASDNYLARLCSTLMLTTPVVHVAWKLATGGGNVALLSDEELRIFSGMTIPRGPVDERIAPVVDGKLDPDSGIFAVLDMLYQGGLLERIPKTPKDVFRPEAILLSAYIRVQSLSVLRDIAETKSQRSPFGHVKPWVSEELQILGFASIGEPISDGMPGRPARQLRLTSWGVAFAEATRKCGIEITDTHRRLARKKTKYTARPKFNNTDRLVLGLINSGQEVPERHLKHMSELGREQILGRSG